MTKKDEDRLERPSASAEDVHSMRAFEARYFPRDVSARVEEQEEDSSAVGARFAEQSVLEVTPILLQALKV